MVTMDKTAGRRQWSTATKSRTSLLLQLFLLVPSITTAFLLSTPSRHEIRSGFVQRMQKTKSQPPRRRKDKMDAIISDMGLQPVSVKPNAAKSLQKNNSVLGPISLETQLSHARNGHAVLRSYLDSSMLSSLRTDILHLMSRQTLDAWRQKVEVASNSPSLAKSCRTIDDCIDELDRLDIPWDRLPFLQYFNTWRHVDTVQELAYSLGEAASILMNVPSVRLYQDAIFCKRAMDGPTPWHTDARMAPFDTSHMITFWIPLQSIPRKDGTALLFVSKSHSDFALPFWNALDGPEFNRLDKRYHDESLVHYMPLQLGDVTVHSGWTLHCADGNPSETNDRLALAISYVDAKAQVRQEAMNDNEVTSRDGAVGYGDNEDRWSYKEWVKHVPPRQPFTHPLVPIVWPLQVNP